MGRVRNPRTGELLPEGYDVDDFHIICPDGFEMPIKDRVAREKLWRERCEKAAPALAHLSTPYASHGEMLADLHREVPAGYTHILAGDSQGARQVVGGQAGYLHGISAAAIRSERASLPDQDDADAVETPPAPIPDVIP